MILVCNVCGHPPLTKAVIGKPCQRWEKISDEKLDDCKGRYVLRSEGVKQHA